MPAGIHQGTLGSYALTGNDSFTQLLLNGDGIDGATSISDSSWYGRGVATVSGNAQIDTAQSKFGGASMLFDGSGDRVSFASSAAFDLTADFTIDCWFRAASLSRYHTIVVREDGGGTAEVMLRVDDTNQLDCFIRTGSGGGSVIGRCTVASGFSTNTWYHIAYERFGSNFTLYKDGVSIQSASSGSSGSSGYSQAIHIGGRSSIAGEGVNGWIDEFRFSVGIARWTANFTPPTRPYG